MKVLFTQTYYLPYISGLTIYLQKLTQELTKKGHQITIITHRHQKKLKKNTFEKKVRLIRVPILFKIHKGFFSLAWPWYCLKEVIENQVIICNLPQPEALWPVMWAKIFKKRVIAIYSCQIVLPDNPLNNLIEKGIRTVHRLICLMVDDIIVYTKDYAQNVPLLKNFRKKTTAILPLVIIKKEQKKTTKRMAALINKKRHSLLIGFAARISAEKGLEYLIKAIPLLGKEYHHFKLVIVGPRKEVIGEEKYFQKINQLAKKYSQIIFLGTLSSIEMTSFYRLIDVLVLPSLNSTEAFGLVQVEAMLNGTPVVASNLPGVRVPIQLTKMGKIIPRQNSQAIAQAIIKIMKNKKKYFLSYQEVRKIFSIQKISEKFNCIIKA